MHISPTIQLPTSNGLFSMTSFGSSENFYLENPSYLQTKSIPYVRIHSECVSGDCFGSYLCDCGQQLHKSLQLISKYGGILFYLRQEGRGQGLHNKMHAVHLEQQEAKTTTQAYQSLGLEFDIRSYEEAINILTNKGIKAIKLISNNPLKHSSLIKNGIQVEPIHLPASVNSYNRSYLETKVKDHNHALQLPEHQNILYFYQPYDDNGRLANFSPHSVTINNRHYQTVEHFYQSQKFKGSAYEDILINAATPTEAKKLSREFAHLVNPMRDTVKEHIMRTGNVAKFDQHPELKEKLLNTGDALIVEKADDDNFRGSGASNMGTNKMGLMLMEIRSYYQSTSLSCYS